MASATWEKGEPMTKKYIEANELIEHVWRDRLDSRERIANLVERMPSEDVVSREAVIDLIHKTILTFFDIADDDDEDTSISEKDKLLLTVNKTICNAIKEM